MTLNKKTIKSVCSHMSHSGPDGELVLGLQMPSGKAIAAFAPYVKSLAKSQPRRERNCSKWIGDPA